MPQGKGTYGSQLGRPREKKQEGGKPSMEDQMEGLAISVEPITVEKEETHTMPDGTVMPGATHEEYEQMLPDEEMEEDYVDFVVSSTLDEEDKADLHTVTEFVDHFNNCDKGDCDIHNLKEQESKTWFLKGITIGKSL